MENSCTAPSGSLIPLSKLYSLSPLSDPPAAMAGTVLVEPPATPNDRLCEIITHLHHQIHSLTLEDTAFHAQSTLQKLVDEAKDIVDGYDPYLTTYSSPALTIVHRMVDHGMEVDWDDLHAKGKTQFRLIPEMSAGGYEAVVLCHFARMAKVSTPYVPIVFLLSAEYLSVQARTILEVGMFTGTTTVSLASVPTVERVVTLELEAFLEKHNRPYFDEATVSEKIDVRIGDAMTSLDMLAKEEASFDMVQRLPYTFISSLSRIIAVQVFIDADKPNYKHYFARIMDLNLLAAGGFIAVDNTTFKATPWAPDTERYSMGRDVHEFNQIVR